MWFWFKLTFLKHEIWVIKNAMRAPILANFLFGTFLVWAIIPVALFVFLTMLYQESWPRTYGALSGLFDITCIVLLAPWFFRWFFVCISLMLGSGERAEAKKRELQNALRKLNVEG